MSLRYAAYVIVDVGCMFHACMFKAQAYTCSGMAPAEDDTHKSRVRECTD